MEEELTPDTWLWQAIQRRCGYEVYEELRTEYTQHKRAYNADLRRKERKRQLAGIEAQLSTIGPGFRKDYLEREAAKLRKRLEE